MLRRLSLLFVALILCQGFFLMAENEGDIHGSSRQTDPIKIEIIAEDETIQPGQPFWVAIRLQIEDHWHSYWKNPGDAGMATAIEWKLPEGFQSGPVEWPFPKRFALDAMVGFGYEGDVMLLAQLFPPATLTTKEPVKIGADIRWLVCSDSSCLPGQSEVSASIPVSSSLPKPNQQWANDFARARTKLPTKQWSLKAQRKNNLIELSLKAFGKHFEVTKAYFCPEFKDTIDYRSEAVLNKSPDNSGNFFMVMHETGPKSDSLKGILVLLAGPDSHVIEALDVNIPITDSGTNNEYVSIADIPKPQTARETSVQPMNDIPSETFEGGIGIALLMAFVGGMILNLMPCVLPVISFKILSFVKMSGQSRSVMLKHGAAFSLGVLISFWILAGIMLMLQAYGRSVGWGFQLQEPLFVAGLAALLLVFGLSLFGVFEMGTSVMSMAGKSHNTASELGGSFLSGVLATAVATPCTGPFLGSAIGFAVTLSPLKAMLIFTSLGVGMAFPYMILSAFPSMLRFLPKPGPWMGTFKEIMGFLMLATVLWLVWVFGAQTNSLSVFLLLAGFFFIALACWVYGKWGSPVKKRGTRVVSTVIAAIFFLLAGYAIFNSTAAWVSAYDDEPTQTANQGAAIDEWEDFSLERLVQLRKQGTPVFIDFTAKWCLICQANHVVLSMNEVNQKFMEAGVVKMKADWTKSDPVITEMLRKFGRNGVPLYLLYGKDPSKAPQILPQMLTPEAVITSLEKME